MKPIFYLPILLTLLACSGTSRNRLTDQSQLKRFLNCDEMNSYVSSALEKQRSASVRSPDLIGVPLATPELAEGGAPLEEGDIVKIEGDYLVAASGQSSIDVFDIRNPSQITKHKSLKPNEDILVKEIILKNNLLIIVSTNYLGTEISVYRVDTPEVEPIKQVKFSTHYLESRISANGNRVILVMNTFAEPNPEFISSSSKEAGSFAADLLGRKKEGSRETPLCDCKDVAYVPDIFAPGSTAATHILSMSLDDELTVKTEMTFMGAQPVLRATEDAYVFAVPHTDFVDLKSGPQTHFILAKDDGQSIVPLVETRADGYLKEQTNMQVRGDYLHAFLSIQTPDKNGSFSFTPQSTLLATFRIATGKLEMTSKTPGIGENEHLFSSLFTNERAYAVTFRQTDPFYIFDLTDGAVPRILGELKIDGFSRQLRQTEDKKILAIGRATEIMNGATLVNGIQVSLFDSNSAGDPILLDRFTFGDQLTYSSAAGTSFWSVGDQGYKAYSFDEDSGLLLLPASYHAMSSNAEAHTIQVIEVGADLKSHSPITGLNDYVDRVLRLKDNTIAVSKGEILSLSNALPPQVLQKLNR